MWENLRVIVISSIMTVLILVSLIWAGIVPTRQEANTYQLKQTIRENFTITGTATSQAFAIPIQNITGPAIARTIYIYAEFNATNNPKGKDIVIELKIIDMEIGPAKEMYKFSSNEDKKFGYTSTSFNANTKRFYLLAMVVYASNASGLVQGIIIQNIQKY